jgi:tetratricopeptide (TPR) repeat protein
MEALDFLIAGRFDEAIEAYSQELKIDHNDISAIAGLASAYMGASKFEEAIPLKLRVHERAINHTPDSPGQHLNLSCAYWCLENRSYAIELAHGLCAGILSGAVNMAPDQAGGATFGLILYYMALTASDTVNVDYALQYLQKLNVKFDKHPHRFFYPKHTVKQLLGELSFEDALEGATQQRNLSAAYRAADNDRSIKIDLGGVLFHDAVFHRTSGDSAGCMMRMKEVFELGYQTEPIWWYLARHELVRH